MPDVVTFDPVNLLVIEINTGLEVNEIDWLEVYSEWKVWAAQGDNLKYPPAFRVVGGDPISDVQNLGSTFFMLAPWKFRPAEYTHQLTRVGNVFRDPAGENFTVPTLGGYTVLIADKVSNLVDAAVARLDLAQLQDAVAIDTVNGDDAGSGTHTEPVQTITRAFEVAAANNLKTFAFRGSLVLDRAATDHEFRGTGELTSEIDVNGFDVEGSSFHNVAVTGAFVGAVELRNSKVGAITGFEGTMHNCGVSSTVGLADNAMVQMVDCVSQVPGTGMPVFTLGANNSLSVRRWSGGFELRNSTAGCTASVDLAPGRLVIDSTCVGGTILVRGSTQLANGAAGATVVSEGLVRSETLEAAALKAGQAASFSASNV